MTVSFGLSFLKGLFRFIGRH